jgi:hypothetical protein
MKEGKQIKYQPGGEWNGHRLYIKRTSNGRLELHDMLVRRYPTPDGGQAEFVTYLSPIELPEGIKLSTKKN